MICPQCNQDRNHIKPSGLCDYCHNMNEYMNGNPNYFLCPICGEADSPDNWMNFTWENMRYCFGCEFWKEKEELYNQGSLLVVGGAAYYLGKEEATPKKGLGRGFGGNPFKIYRFDTKETFTTTNLWFNGPVPSRFRHILKDNAKFVKED